MHAEDLITAAQWLFLLYFTGLQAGYLGLNVISLLYLPRHMKGRVMEDLPQIYSGFEPPVSIVVPAYNEEANIAASVRSLLRLNYPEFEVVVVNDGSKDSTLEVLKREFALVPFPEAYRVRIETKRVRRIYLSKDYPNLRVIDKDGGGKADSLNAGVNGARYPLFCGIDVGSTLQRDGLHHIVQPFLEDPSTIACTGTIRVANGCEVSGGHLVRAGLPRNLLALLQIAESLRAFLFGRFGWSPLNALFMISGNTFGLFHKETVVAAGGYRGDAIGGEMELIVRLHRVLREAGRKYRITFVPDPVCWREAPEDLRTLVKQRVRWQRGLGDSLTLNRALLFSRGGGAPGWLAFPFTLFFEWLGPLIELAGYAFMFIACLCGFISFTALAAFLLIAVGFGLLASMAALLFEEMSFHTYPKVRHLLVLFLVVIAENAGYRQLNSYWRLKGLVQWWMTRGEARWGEMTGKASWHTR